MSLSKEEQSEQQPKGSQAKNEHYFSDADESASTLFNHPDASQSPQNSIKNEDDKKQQAILSPTSLNTILDKFPNVSKIQKDVKKSLKFYKNDNKSIQYPNTQLMQFAENGGNGGMPQQIAMTIHTIDATSLHHPKITDNKRKKKFYPPEMFTPCKTEQVQIKRE